MFPTHYLDRRLFLSWPEVIMAIRIHCAGYRLFSLDRDDHARHRWPYMIFPGVIIISHNLGHRFSPITAHLKVTSDFRDRIVCKGPSKYTTYFLCRKISYKSSNRWLSSSRIKLSISVYLCFWRSYCGQDIRMAWK